ncbi:unnamed protein product [Blepharisma stoltei]|uniref:Penicillin amidase n=1 Tax=Blepharisma stoltei TaxID=1481888 RepID=A0AAU9I819_9CILI|nr:unnamed protein product [Blepharisma stoltei]
MNWIAVLSFVIPPILSLAGYIYYTIPSYSDSKIIPSVWDKITIERDGKGIPHITASSTEDACFALGYVHAQDRMLQLDLLRRISEGSLSEIFGNKTLELDIFSRNIGFKRQALLSLPKHSNHTLLLLHRYSEGINAWAEANPLPFEYFITWSHWQYWKPVDTLSIWRYVSFFQNSEWRHELFRAKLAATIGERLAKIILPYDESMIFPKSYIINDYDLPQELKRTSSFYASHTSNGKINDFETLNDEIYYLNLQTSAAFVVSGNKTKSGKPLISSQIYFSSRIPTEVYLSKITTNNIKLSGTTIPGIPFFYQGENGSISWAAVPILADVIDLYVHKIHHTEELYLLNENWEPFYKITEKIAVKGQEPVEVAIKLTKYGPMLINPSILNFKEAISIRWTANEIEDNDFDSIIKINTAKNPRDFRLALSGIKVPNFSVVYGLNTGIIGYQAVGLFPQRESYGAVPLDGSRSDADWKKFIDFKELPYVLNPKEGFILAAGNSPISASYKHSISFSGTYFNDKAYRMSNAIKETLTIRKSFAIDNAVEILYDNHTEFWASAQNWISILKNETAKRILENSDCETAKDCMRIFESLIIDKEREEASEFVKTYKQICKKKYSSISPFFEKMDETTNKLDPFEDEGKSSIFIHDFGNIAKSLWSTNSGVSESKLSKFYNNLSQGFKSQKYELIFANHTVMISHLIPQEK